MRAAPLISFGFLMTVLGCAGTPVPSPTLSATSLSESVTLDGRAVAPAGLDAGNGVVYLQDAQEKFLNTNGRLVAVAADAQGRYRFQAGVPQKSAITVVALLPNEQSLFGLLVPVAGPNRLDVTRATTAVTAFLRERAKQAGKQVASYDLAQLPSLVKKTSDAYDAGNLKPPDLHSGARDAMTMAYALGVGQNIAGLGDAWARLLGTRPLAAEPLAGGGEPGVLGDGGPAASFYGPAGICRDRAGNLFVADAGNHRIRRMEAVSGVVSTVAGTGVPGFGGDNGQATEARLDGPRGVTLDRRETALYIFDTENRRVRRLDLASGVITTMAGDPPQDALGDWTPGFAGDGGPAAKARLWAPVSGAFDVQGNLYMADRHLIRRITPAGEIQTTAGQPELAGGFAGENVPASEARLNAPTGLLVTPDEQLYIADTGNHVVRKVDLTTRLIATLAGVPGRRGEPREADGKLATETALDAPAGVAVDGRNGLYIAERGAGIIRRVNEQGRLTTVMGGGTLDTAGESLRVKLHAPVGLVVEPSNDVVVLDDRPGRVWRVWTRFAP